uniref:Uncharacterized protein n=1 Tax=Anopheles atroparvus TaxID=41427 RepID=A0A182IVU7_ANOAO
MPRVRKSRGKRQVYWWTEEITRLRARCNRTRRRLKRERDEERREILVEELRRNRRALKQEIRRSKRVCFEELQESLQDDVFGKGYKVVMARLGGRGQPQEKDPAKLSAIIKELFPRHEQDAEVFSTVKKTAKEIFQHLGKEWRDFQQEAARRERTSALSSQQRTRRNDVVGES